MYQVTSSPDRPTRERRQIREAQQGKVPDDVHGVQCPVVIRRRVDDMGNLDWGPPHREKIPCPQLPLVKVAEGRLDQGGPPS